MLGDIDLVGSGGRGELVGVPDSQSECGLRPTIVWSVDLLIGLWVDRALVGVDEDVLARGLEGRVEVGLAVELGVRHVGCLCWERSEVGCFGFGLKSWLGTGVKETGPTKEQSAI